MAKIRYLDNGSVKEMKQRKPIAIQYTCKCGAVVSYYTDEKPKKLEKCWKCQEKVK